MNRTLKHLVGMLVGVVGLSTLASPARAETLVELWAEPSVAWSPIKAATLEFEQKLAFGTAPFQVVEVSPDFSFSYDVTKWLTPGVGYRHIERRDKNDAFESWNRLYADVSVAPELGKFILDYRLRLQTQIPTDASRKTRKAVRNRLQAGYKVTKSLEPYVGVETSTRVGGSNGTQWKQMRWAVGADFSLKPHRFGLFGYLDQEQVDVNDPSVVILGASYRYKF
ncbi:MAG: DUF2490 domain-containing protein [Polyangiaceae bacterium]|nr:DUF2490 domain-containing protein [Polyangiaceae bacterium]